MIVGIGHDVCSIKRMEALLARFGARIAQRCLTPLEMDDFLKCPPHQQPSYLAKRFAAKEAAAKALGTGIACGVTLKDFEISRAPHTQPTLVLKGAALQKVLALHRCHISLSDEYPLASAFVVIEALDQTLPKSHA